MMAMVSISVISVVAISLVVAMVAIPAFPMMAFLVFTLLTLPPSARFHNRITGHEYASINRGTVSAASRSGVLDSADEAEGGYLVAHAVLKSLCRRQRAACHGIGFIKHGSR